MDWANESYQRPNWFSNIKDQVDILDVLTKVGARIRNTRQGGWWDDEVAYFCPFCSDISSRKPAGRANTNKQVCHCWSCGFGGDVINVAVRYLKVDAKDTLKWFEGEFGVKVDA